ncbi:MAG: rRNA small subunit methyltransferase 1, partial [Gemmatimonadales bacterium]
AWLASGEDLALVSDAGTPLVSDPGQRIVEAAVVAGFTIVPIPGASAVLAALAGSGFSGDRFSFLGFPPRKGGERGELMDRVSTSPDTVVLFESPERTLALLEALEKSCGPHRPVAVARELTKLHEEFVRGTLAHVREHFQLQAPRGEIVVVVSGASEPVDTGPVDEGAARALAKALLDEGLTPSRAAKEVARRLKLPRNLSYEAVQSVSADASSDDEGTG